MSNRRGTHSYRSELTRRMVVRYFLSLLGFVAIYILLVIFGWEFVQMFVWRPWDPIYRLLCWMREYILLFSIAVCLIGWTLITYFFMSKPLQYLDDIVAASRQLTTPGEEPIVLPEAVKSVQDQLNLFREQALRNAMLAREAEQRKNDLIVYLAHDLKTPLTSVIGYLTLLRDEPQISQELRAKYTGIALDKAERLEDLINEFFDITRFSLTTLTLEPERTSLSRMLEQVISEFDPILAEKNLSWRTELEPGVEILCDRDKLSRVFDNLIRNAVNYSYAGSEIFLSMARRGEEVEILVRNHGRTIPPEKLSHIFEQFYRVDSSRSSATGGAGLGLAIAREIVELHGGAIRAESANESIAFQIRIPVECQKIV